MTSPAATQYELDLFNLLRRATQEGSRNYIYLDGLGIPTLGVGTALIVKGFGGVHFAVYNLDDILDSFIANQTVSGTTVGSQVLRGQIKNEILKIVGQLNQLHFPQDGNNPEISIDTIIGGSTFAHSSSLPSDLGGTITDQGILDSFVYGYRDFPGIHIPGGTGLEGVDGLIGSLFDVNSLYDDKDWERIKREFRGDCQEFRVWASG